MKELTTEQRLLLNELRGLHERMEDATEKLEILGEAAITKSLEFVETFLEEISEQN